MAISIIRTIIIFLAIVAAMRLMGKRQIGELEPSELVVAVLISDLASHPLQDPGIPLLYGIVPVVTLLCSEILISGLSMKHIRLREAIYGKPSILIVSGKINQTEMDKNRVTLDELMVELRKQGVTDLNTVRYGILETGGSLSILLKAAEAPATPTQLGVNPEENTYPVILINNGRVIQKNLNVLGVTGHWLEKQLSDRKISSPKTVYLMTADEKRNVYLEEKEAKK